jgi:hypothetical protein
VLGSTTTADSTLYRFLGVFAPCNELPHESIIVKLLRILSGHLIELLFKEGRLIRVFVLLEAL